MAMLITDAGITAALRLGTAAGIGLAVGLEREWSGHSDGPGARFAGLRTFLMIGLLGGAAGLLAGAGHEAIAASIFAAVAAMSISAYILAVRGTTDRDGTTEVAAILVAALGVVAGAVSWSIAAGAGSLVVLALNEKKRLHGAVGRLHREELSAALQFAVLALVVLPLLPRGPYFGWIALRPQTLWLIVLVFSALNFAGFVARKSASAGRGFVLTGMVGGVISSTAVSLGFARASRIHPAAGAALGLGVIGACTVLVPRVLLVSGLLNPAVARELVVFIAPAGLIGAAVIAAFWIFGKSWQAGDARALEGSLLTDDKNPLRLLVAIKLAIVFQLAIIAVTWIRMTLPPQGLYGGAVILGLTDVDALTVSMSTGSSSLPPGLAARAIGTGILANTIFKLGIAAIVGSGRFRLIASVTLLAMIAGILAALLLF